jgi:creatinine amidohydrolase
MTTFVPFADLTWPEVARLAPETPLIIPVGEGYEPATLAHMLGEPPAIGLLPALPYGWVGSGLAAPPDRFAAYAGNLLGSLIEDGFTRAALLAPPGIHIALPESLMLRLGPVSPIPPLVLPPPDGRVIIIPIGHTEQHGYHLPLSTDTDIIAAISRGVAAAAPEQALALPAFPYGVSTHRRSFAGTLSAGGRAFEDFWLGVVEALVGMGHDRFYLLSGHGGNCSFLTTVVKYAGERHPHIFCATSWLYLSGPAGVAALERHRRSAIGGMGHACELETSLMLRLRPEVVQMERVVDEVDFVSTPSYYMDWVEGGALIANPPWEDDTATGAYGAGSLATAEHGRLWLEAAIAEKVGHVGEILEQGRRRGERRRRNP